MYAYLLVRTAYHRGGIVSRHRTLEAVVAAQRRRYRMTECVCGCAVVVESGDYDALPYAPDCRRYDAPARR